MLFPLTAIPLCINPHPYNALHTRNWVGVALCFCLSAASNTKTRRPSFRRAATCYVATRCPYLNAVAERQRSRCTKIETATTLLHDTKHFSLVAHHKECTTPILNPSA